VADEYPWPERTGYRLRLAAVLRALATTATVDLLAVVLDERAAREPPPPDLPLGRHAAVVAGPLAGGGPSRARRWATGRLPRALLWRDWGPARVALDGWAETPYQVAWFSHAPAYLALADLVRCPRIVDLDNLDAFVLRHRRRVPPSARHAGPGELARSAARSLADLVDERRWHRVQVRVAASADAVVVCSDLDRRRLGTPNAVVVPNGYERPSTGPTAGGGLRSPVEPVLLMVGLLTYEPNRDAAEFFAGQVLPRLRSAVPAARFRVVGRYDDEAQVAVLRASAGVSVAGEVADVRPELAAAGVVVVPVRFGGGTRIKILEAFAHGVPVVTTTVGCEGLDVVGDEHLLVADTPDAFAAACARVLADAGLRARLTENARARWAERYRWEVIAPAITDVIGRCTQG
jgi:glycosyltransferase involved in cell wall biosynthesis